MAHNNESNGPGKDSSNESQPSCSAAPGSTCCTPGSSRSTKAWKTIILLLIIAAAGGVLARSVMRKGPCEISESQPAFVAADAVKATDALSTTKPATAEPPGPKDNPNNTTAINLAKETEIPDKAAPSLWGPPLDSLASLNKLAADKDAVFILIADKDKSDLVKVIEAAVKKVRSNGSRVSGFNLKQGTPDYTRYAQQLSGPGVLTMVKGRGSSTVSGDITEAKLLQAFVTASRPRSSCCPGGSGSGKCPPPAKK